MPTVGKRFRSDNKVHIAKTLKDFEALTPKQKTQIYRTMERLFEHGYIGSLEVSETTILEFYEKLPEVLKEPPKEEVPEEPEPEKREEPFYGKTPYEKEQLLDEDNYQDW
jgi:hypothetical protein